MLEFTRMGETVGTRKTIVDKITAAFTYEKRQSMLPAQDCLAPNRPVSGYGPGGDGAITPVSSTTPPALRRKWERARRGVMPPAGPHLLTHSWGQGTNDRRSNLAGSKG